MLPNNSAGFSSILWGIKILIERYLNEKFEGIISHADIIQEACKAIGADINVSENDYTHNDRLYPLKSLFSEIHFGDTNLKNKAHYIYPKSDFNCIPYPEEETGLLTRDDFGEWKKQLASDWIKIRAFLSDDKYTELLLVFLQRYTAFLPAYNKKDTSLPLYDLIKLITAVSSCLEKSKDFIILAVDFSGVQDFVYTIASRSALKTLRARSFYLELLTHHLAHEFLDKFGLSSANIIYAGGGKFYLLLPNTTEVNNSIIESRKNLNKWLYDEFEGRLHLAIAWVETNDLANIKDKWRKLQNKVEKAKKRKFIDLFNDDIFSENGVFGIKEPEQKTSQDECEVCHKDTEKPEHVIKDDNTSTKACKFCSGLFHFGGMLKYLHLRNPEKFLMCVKESDEDAKLKVPLLDGKSVFYVMADKSDELTYKRKFIINNLCMSDAKDSIPFFAETYITLNKNGNEAADFEELANKSVGTDLLGALRLDVDNLGLIFSQENRITHLSALSRNLDYFFKFYLNSICKGKMFGNEYEDSKFLPLDICNEKRFPRKVSIIYSGGDDLFLVGAWSDVVELAFDIQACFERFTCYNPDVTISGGVVVKKPKYPLYLMANDAKESEEKAKANLDNCNECIKNADPLKRHSDCLLFREHPKEDKCKRKSSIALFYSSELDYLAEQLEENHKEEKVISALKWKDAICKIIPTVQDFRKLGDIEDDVLKRDFPMSILSKNS